CRCGGVGSGRSAARLYQCVGTVDGTACPSGSSKRGVGSRSWLTVASFVVEVLTPVSIATEAGSSARLVDPWECRPWPAGSSEQEHNEEDAKPIAVTGATGHLGRLVLAELRRSRPAGSLV